MWKKSIRFIFRYFAIGVLVGVGIYAIDEIHWRLFGSERVAMMYQSIDRLSDCQDNLVLEPPVTHREGDESTRTTLQKRTKRTDLFRPTPYFVNGQIQGYRIYPGSDRQEFLSLGLRPGDLVTEIDGEPLVNSTIACELFEKALGGQPVILSVRRSGKLERVEINAD